MKVQIESIGGIIPTYQTGGAAGCDLHAHLRQAVTIHPRGWERIPCGVKVAIPEGYEGQVRPRSGLATRYAITVANSPGTIDSDYRGELLVTLINHGPLAYTVNPNDRIAQLVICPVIRAEWDIVEALDSTPRGTGGHGSTGV